MPSACIACSRGKEPAADRELKLSVIPPSHPGLLRTVGRSRAAEGVQEL